MRTTADMRWPLTDSVQRRSAYGLCVRMRRDGDLLPNVFLFLSASLRYEIECCLPSKIQRKSWRNHADGLELGCTVELSMRVTEVQHA